MFFGTGLKILYKQPPVVNARARETERDKALNEISAAFSLVSQAV